jgi:hypothetical protein
MDLSWLARVLSHDTRRLSSGNSDCAARELQGPARVGDGDQEIWALGFSSATQIRDSSSGSSTKLRNLASSSHGGEGGE